MYVLIIGRGYPTAKYKMNGIFEFDQAKALQNSGIQVIYAALDARSIRRWRKWGLEKKQIRGIQVYALNIPLGRIHRSLRDKINVLALRYLYRQIVREQGLPQIIHSHFIGTGYIAARVFQDSAIPLVLTEHYSGMNQKKLSSYHLKLGWATYPRMTKVIAVSGALAGNLKEKFGITAAVIPNVVDLKKFSWREKPENTSENNFNFVSVGNLTSSKKMDLLISSFQRAFKDQPNVKLYIFGEGPDRTKLENLIKELDLSRQVYLMGLTERSLIAARMGQSDCFVLASESETFGLAYVEALACGLPVIATTCGGPEEYVDRSNGLLIPVNDRERLVEALKKMQRDIDVYDPEKISEAITEKFSEKSITDQIHEIYHQVIAREKV